MPADIEAKTLVIDGAADSADMIRILLYHGHAVPLFRQEIRRREPSWTGADHHHVGRFGRRLHQIHPKFAADFAS